MPKRSNVSTRRPASYGLANHVKRSLKQRMVGGSKMKPVAGRPSALKRTLKGAKSVIRKMKG